MSKVSPSVEKKQNGIIIIIMEIGKVRKGGGGTRNPGDVHSRLVIIAIKTRAKRMTENMT